MSDELHPEIVIGDLGGDHIVIGVQGRLHPGAEDFGDGNWLSALVKFDLGQFNGKISASLRAEELRKFGVELGKLNTSLHGEAVLESMEDWLTLRVAVAKSGRLDVTGRLVDRPGDGNQLIFEIDGLDQSYLAAVLESLAEVESLFPVFGI